MEYDFFRYACPKCKRETEYHTNPAYLHDCESCGYQTTLDNLIHAVDLKKLNYAIKKNMGERIDLMNFLKKYPLLENGRVIERKRRKK